jgi:antimicrobial peptide system SdpA family protein
MKLAIFILCMLIFIGVAINVGLSFLGFNPISSNYKTQTSFRTFIPQGWGFFTRNPREKALLFYQKQGNKWQLVNSSSANYKKLFGLSRLSRRENIELGYITSQLNGVKNWLDCDNNMPNTCEPDSINIVKNNYKNPIIEGEYLIRIVEPVPWAWSKLMTEEQRKSKVLKIFVQNDTTKKR